jgi:hypothetical protein
MGAGEIAVSGGARAPLSSDMPIPSEEHEMTGLTLYAGPLRRR